MIQFSIIIIEYTFGSDGSICNLNTIPLAVNVSDPASGYIEVIKVFPEDPSSVPEHASDCKSGFGQAILSDIAMDFLSQSNSLHG